VSNQQMFGKFPLTISDFDKIFTECALMY